MKKLIHQRIKKGASYFFLSFALLCCSMLQAQAQQYVEGVHFVALDNSTQGTHASNEVMEVFWYGCGHCYAFEPLLNNWKSENPDISFIRSPVAWDRTTTHHAQLYFTAASLGITEDIHSKIFNEIHQQENYLLSQESAKAFFITQGVSADDFDEAYNSFGVNTDLRRADSMQRDAGISSVPAMIVAGKYLIKVNADINNHQQVLNIVEYLLALESS